jgi:putative transposase
VAVTPRHAVVAPARRALAPDVSGGENGPMPRTARASIGGYCYHALNRGNGRAQVFHDADDYAGFVRLLRQACARLPMRLVGFCLLPKHFHRVLWPHGDGDLGPWMQWLLTAHVHGYRQRYGGSGHVWQGRFKAFPIEADEHLRTVLRYAERNPLRAGLVARAEDRAWSSLPLWLRPPRLPWLEPGPAPRQAGWLEYVQEPAQRGGTGRPAAECGARHPVWLAGVGRADGCRIGLGILAPSAGPPAEIGFPRGW